MTRRSATHAPLSREPRALLAEIDGELRALEVAAKSATMPHLFEERRQALLALRRRTLVRCVAVANGGGRD